MRKLVAIAATNTPEIFCHDFSCPIAFLCSETQVRLASAVRFQLIPQWPRLCYNGHLSCREPFQARQQNLSLVLVLTKQKYIDQIIERLVHLLIGNWQAQIGFN